MYTFSDVFPLYKMSYMWYTFFGAAVTVIVAHVFIVVYGRTEADSTDATLIAPFLRKYYTKKKPQILPDDQPHRCAVFLEKITPLDDESGF